MKFCLPAFQSEAIFAFLYFKKGFYSHPHFFSSVLLLFFTSYNSLKDERLSGELHRILSWAPADTDTQEIPAAGIVVTFGVRSSKCQLGAPSLAFLLQLRIFLNSYPRTLQKGIQFVCTIIALSQVHQQSSLKTLLWNQPFSAALWIWNSEQGISWPVQGQFFYQ